MKKLYQKLHKQLIPGMLSLVVIATVLTVAFIAYFNKTLGWFSSNRIVAATGMNVRTQELPFELAVAGDNIGSISYTKHENDNGYESTPINEFDAAIKAPDGTTGSYTSRISNTPSTYYVTSAGNDTIIWRLEDTYNPTSPGIGPDSRGEITFYILPKADGDLNVSISLDIEGYSAKVEKNDDYTFKASDFKKITSTDADYPAVTYLNTHMLFFTGKTGNYYTGLIDGKLDLSYTNCTANVMIPVTLYWVWPNTFAQYTCIAAETAEIKNIADSDPDENATQEYKNAASETVSAIRQYVMEHSTDILYDISEQDAMGYLSSSESQPYAFDQTHAAANINALSAGYNNADQEIGTKVHYFLLTLTAGPQ